jgi:sigma-54 specific flagellar transcriptional regulator A
MAIMHPHAVVGVQDLPRQFQLQDDELPPITLPDSIAEKTVSVVSFDQCPDESDENADDTVTVDVSRVAGERLAQDPHLLPLNGLDLKEYLANLERNLIEQALDDCGGVVARAADRLNIRRTTLVEKMRKYDMTR